MKEINGEPLSSRAVDSFFGAVLRGILLVASVPSSQAETGSPQRLREV